MNICSHLEFFISQENFLKITLAGETGLMLRCKFKASRGGWWQRDSFTKVGYKQYRSLVAEQ